MKFALPFIALMETMKLYAIASYFFLPLGAPLPLLPASLTLLGGFALSLVLGAAGGRLVYHLLAHALGLSVSFIVVLTLYRGMPFILANILPVNDHELAVFVLVLGWTAVFWFRGVWLMQRDKGARFCVARFDEGIAVFLFLLCIATLMHLENPAPRRLILPFFMFSSLALGLYRIDGVRRGGLSRRSRRLVVLPVTIVFIIASAAIIPLAPLLFDPAARLGRSIRSAFLGLEPHLVRFLRWLLGFYSLPANAGSASPSAPGEAPPPPSGEPRSELVLKILFWALGILAAVSIAALAGYGLYWLFRRLSTRVEKRGKGLDASFLSAWLRALLRGCARMLGRVGTLLSRRAAVRSAALSAYKKLLDCARMAGVRREACETPREFASRLSREFPRAASGAALAVDALEREVYGGQQATASTERGLIDMRRKTRTSAFLAERVTRTLKNGLSFRIR